MKIRCFYKILEMIDSDLFLTCAKIINEENYNINYSRYLLGFLIYTTDSIKYLLENIEKVIEGEEEVFERLIEMPDTYVYIYKEKALFEHNREYWEEWECPTLVVKQALEGWKKFLELPKDKDTVYEFEISDLDL